MNIPSDTTTIVYYFIASMFVFGLIGYAIGKPKGEGKTGFWMGFFLGIIGVISTACVRGYRIKCPFCTSMISMEAVVCPHCGRDVAEEEE